VYSSNKRHISIVHRWRSDLFSPISGGIDYPEQPDAQGYHAPRGEGSMETCSARPGFGKPTTTRVPFGRTVNRHISARRTPCTPVTILQAWLQHIWPGAHTSRNASSPDCRAHAGGSWQGEGDPRNLSQSAQKGLLHSIRSIFRA
jgi:hypothetical protein